MDSILQQITDWLKGMRLVITEKPSVAQSIAKVIGADKRCDGYLEGNGYVVSWCVGHLVELAEPGAYDERFDKWNINDLPIMPADWQYQVTAATRKQYKILKDLMQRDDVESLIEATDAGREGELIFRLVYNQAKCKKPFERLWISSMEDEAILEGFENLKPGTEFDILTNKHINMLYSLIKKTGVDVANISLEDAEVEKLFTGLNKEVSLVGIPEFDTEFVREAAKEFGASTFTDVVQMSCLMHGTNVWENNGQDLLHVEGITKDSIIASREDIFDCLLALGITKEDSFKIAEFVRKGKARPESEKWQEYRKMITEAGAPDWFVFSCEKIRYMFPRAHAYIYALHAWWIAWFKLYYPKEFYDTYLDLQASENLKEMLSKGREAFEIYKAGYSAAISDSYWGKDIDSAHIEEFLVAEEMLKRLCAK